MTKVQEAFKVWKWAELAVLAGLNSAQFQMAPVPLLMIKSKNGLNKLCSEPNCASYYGQVCSLFCKNQVTLQFSLIRYQAAWWISKLKSWLFVLRLAKLTF